MLGQFRHAGDCSPETEREIVRSHVSEAPDPLVGRCVRVLRAVREEFDWNLGTRGAIIAAEGLMTVPEESRSDDLFVEVMTDVLSSKVSGRSELESARECVVEAIDASGGDDR